MTTDLPPLLSGRHEGSFSRVAANCTVQSSTDHLLQGQPGQGGGGAGAGPRPGHSIPHRSLQQLRKPLHLRGELLQRDAEPAGGRPRAQRNLPCLKIKGKGINKVSFYVSIWDNRMSCLCVSILLITPLYSSVQSWSSSVRERRRPSGRGSSPVDCTETTGLELAALPARCQAGRAAVECQQILNCLLTSNSPPRKEFRLTFSGTQSPLLSPAREV